MTKKTIQTIQNQKNQKKITCLTAYTSSIARIVDNYVDITLIGDSLGSTIYGMKNTQHVTLEMMKEHGRAVAKNCKKSFTIVDMPYNTYNNNKDAFSNIKNLLNYTKCQAIKIEIDESKINLIKYLTKNKIQVVSHIGVTPQKYKSFDKIRSVGNSNKEKHNLLKLAKESETLGAKAVLLECITTDTAKLITENISIPTIGIGASKYCDGQVLVFDDLINLTTDDKKPKFVKNYFNFNKVASNVVKKYNREVKLKKFPSTKFTYN